MTPAPSHIITLNTPVALPEEGLLLGNGDLSVSIYQKPNQIVWRFGKGDVWDRRHDLSGNPRPLTMDELRHGLRDEGWRCPPYAGPAEALRGTSDPKRMQEVLNPPPSVMRPYPMPKPVGELSLCWPADLPQTPIVQRLIIEEARVEIDCSWPDGERLRVHCFVHPTINALAVRWWFESFDPGAPQHVHRVSPLRLSLYRWADPPIAEFAARWTAQYNHPAFAFYVQSGLQPLSPPQVVLGMDDAPPVIEQGFYPDPLFPQGFKYWLGAITNKRHVVPVDTGPLREARLYMADLPPTSLNDLLQTSLKELESDHDHGWIVVPITTSSDSQGPAATFQALRTGLATNPEKVLDQWQDINLRAARDFWSVSSVRIAEPEMENLWYETLHACRCIYRRGTVPPALFFPSTINDYSLWNGDYHPQYNLPQPFWGVHTANHAELAEAYFAAMAFHNQIGQKIARDYCGTRGTFIQISGYPILAQDDPVPTAPMGRMPYMTGWAAEIFWWHYLYTRDRAFLRDRGYPFIRDCALFYTDFLQLGGDGLYHAFPSCWGEEGYDGNPETSTDASQTMEYAEFSMRMALRAAETLDVDADLRTAWRDRLSKLAPGRGPNEFRPLGPRTTKQTNFNPPDFRPGLHERHPADWPLSRRHWGWCDKFVRQLMRDLRGGQFQPARDLPEFLKVIRRWRRPNGLIWPMPRRYYGPAGAWTENLGIFAPFQEMLLQSWDGVLRVFPAWPPGVDASFRHLRAEGAFLVSATWKNGGVASLVIESVQGGPCRFKNPWPKGSVEVRVVDQHQPPPVITPQQEDVFCFPTQPGCVYELHLK